VLFLDNDAIMRVLDMRATLEALRIGYRDLDAGDAVYSPRIDLYVPTSTDEGYYQWGSMAGICRSYGVLAVRMKSDVVTWTEGRAQKHCIEPGTYSGVLLVYSTENGAPLALLQDGYIQHLRVGAAAAIGADDLARPDASALGLLGSGGMAWAYLEAMALVRPLRTVRVYSPSERHREALAQRARTTLRLDSVAVDSAREAVDGADILVTATNSTVPTFDPAWVADGCHMTCVSRRELSTEIVQRADRVFQLGASSIPVGTDIPGMQWRAGGYAALVAGQPDERGRIPEDRSPAGVTWPSLTDLRTGTVPGRTSASDTTLLVATGTQGLQFAAVAGKTLQLARDAGLGAQFPTEWFLQDIRD
jgi:ornithine cyclodeaminase/alanine dehydrogenase-like protein (mu-crystallin family)